MIAFWSQGGIVLGLIVLVSLFAWWRLLAGWQLIRYHRVLREKRFEQAMNSNASAFQEEQPDIESLIYEQAKLLGGQAHKQLKKRLKHMLDARAERLRRPGRFVAVMAGVCPLLGLLGTVFGMLEVFHVIHQSGFSELGRMAGGITQALLTTQAGLVMALPLVVGHSWLTWQYERDQKMMLIECHKIQARQGD